MPRVGTTPNPTYSSRRSRRDRGCVVRPGEAGVALDVCADRHAGSGAAAYACADIGMATTPSWIGILTRRPVQRLLAAHGSGPVRGSVR